MASRCRRGPQNVREATCGVPDSRQVLQLRSQWMELCDRERRAQWRNRHLLQDFQKAQEAVKHLAARTAAMGTIRAEYEKQLEQQFPRWQKSLDEKRLQDKEQAELRLEGYLWKREEGNRRDGCSRRPGAGISRSSAGASQPSAAPVTHHSDAGKRSRSIRLNSAAFHDEDYSHSAPDLLWNPMSPPSWLTQVQPPASAPQAPALQRQQADVSVGDRGFQERNRAGDSFHLAVPLPAFQPFDPCWLLSPTEPGSSWYGLYAGFPARSQFTRPQVPWPVTPSFDPHSCATSKAQEQETKRSFHAPSRRWEWEGSCSLRNERFSDRSFELDVRPVRLANTPGGSSRRNSVCSSSERDDNAKVPRSRKDKREGTSKSHTAGKKTSSNGSSSGCKPGKATVPKMGASREPPMEQTLDTRLHRRSSSSAESVSEMTRASPDKEMDEREEVSQSQEEAVEQSAEVLTDVGAQEGAEDEEIQHSCPDVETEQDTKEEGYEGLVREERQEGGKEEGLRRNKRETNKGPETDRRDEDEDGEVEGVAKEEMGKATPQESSGSGDREAGESDAVPEEVECVDQEQEERSEEEVGEKLDRSEQEGGSENGDEAEAELQRDENDEAQGSRSLEEGCEGEGDTEVERKSWIGSDADDDGSGGADGGQPPRSLKEGETEDEVEDDISKERKEANEEGISEEEAEGSERDDAKESGKAEDSEASDSKDEEDEEESDSEDEIISSQLEWRERTAAEEGWKAAGESTAKVRIRKIEEEDEEGGDGEEDSTSGSRAEHQRVVADGEAADLADAQEDIEGLLAPRGSSPAPHTQTGVYDKAAETVLTPQEEPRHRWTGTSLREERKRVETKVQAHRHTHLWQNLEDDSAEEMAGGERGGALLPPPDNQDDLDDFYD
ncbi:uncharacterized protein LOC108925291 [Arapaima gigas]